MLLGPPRPRTRAFRLGFQTKSYKSVLQHTETGWGRAEEAARHRGTTRPPGEAPRVLRGSGSHRYTGALAVSHVITGHPSPRGPGYRVRASIVMR